MVNRHGLVLLLVKCVILTDISRAALMQRAEELRAAVALRTTTGNQWVLADRTPAELFTTLLASQRPSIATMTGTRRAATVQFSSAVDTRATTLASAADAEAPRHALQHAAAVNERSRSRLNLSPFAASSLVGDQRLTFRRWMLQDFWVDL